MEKKNPLSALMQESMAKVREMVDTNTIVGQPITTPDGVTLIPVSKVSFGFGGGGAVEVGVYGTTTNKVKAQQSKKGGRIKYFLMRIFQPYEVLRHAYPILFKHKWLTPFCQVARWFRIVFKNGVKRPMTEFSASKNFSKEEQDQTQELLKN